MALNPLLVGDNPQQPFITAETYIPDQLVIGNRNIVTDAVTVSGAATLARGTVMGQAKFGSVTASFGKTYASGTITIAALPTAGDTLTVDGTVITFNALPGAWPTELPPPGTQWIATTVAAQAASLAEYLNASTDPNISLMDYSVLGAVITATANVIGTAGNAYTLATSDTGAFTLSGANLTGGTANSDTTMAATSISAGPFLQAGNYTATFTSATAFNVLDPHGEDVGVAGTFGSAFKSSQINFTLATGTPAAGDIAVFTGNPTNTGVYKLSVATATDGSENPAGILVDYTDPTSGNVTAGVYLGGEFNGNALILDPSWSGPNAVKAALRPLGIFIKFPVGAADPS